MIELLTNKMMNLKITDVVPYDYFQESKVANIVRGTKPIATS